MFGEIIKYRYPYSQFDDDMYEIVQLQEPHEVGDIINEYWLILESGCPFGQRYDYKCEIGQHVLTVDIRRIDIFSTDRDYDKRTDLLLINTQQRFYGREPLRMRLYHYKK
jgi:hypothetical protein